MFVPHAYAPARQSAKMLGSLAGFDGIDTSYSFAIFEIGAAPAASNAIYMFCRHLGSTYVPLYIGKAEELSTRLTSHERLNEAIRLGATYLLVHVPGYAARVGLVEAERRLIAHYNPPLNTHYRTDTALSM